MSELKPCPFCGHEPMIFNQTGLIVCAYSMCGVNPESKSNEDWNSRALTEHLRLKEEECKQLQQDNEKLTGKIADMAPVVSQANQWREEHLRTSKLLTQSNKDNAELVEALQGLVAVVGESTGVCGYHLNGDIAEWDEFGEVAVALQLLESMK